MGDVKFNSSGGGSVTLTPPSTASNLTVTLPSTSGTLLNTGATSFTFAGAGTISATTTLTLNGGAGSNGLVLDASNNVGIGTSSPAYKLDVKGNIRANITASGDGTGVLLTNDGSTNGRIEFLTSDATGRYRLDAIGDSGFAISTVSGGVWAQALYIDRVSRNLGLGVTPSAWANTKAIDIAGYGAISTDTLNDGNVSVSWNAYATAYNAWKYKNTGAASRYAQEAGKHYWYTAASGSAGTAVSFTQAMTLDASGNLLLGDTSNLGGPPKAYIKQAAASTGLYVYVSAASSLSSAALVLSKYDNNSTTSQVFAQFTINALSVGSGMIVANGASNAAFAAYSDVRLKENITALPNQLANICALKPSEFDYKDGSGHQIGFIAQEMQEVYPDVVGEGEDGMLTITGWSKTEARLVKAIQELSAKNSELESRLAALEGK